MNLWRQEVSQPPALDAARSLLEDVASLLDHHPAQKDPKPGKPPGPGYGPLLRAGTALCYTAWEVYVEEALLESVSWLLDNRSPEDLPEALRTWVAGQNGDPWAFVGDSWRAAVLGLVRSRLEGDRSEERRVGKECRWRRSRYQHKEVEGESGV